MESIEQITRRIRDDGAQQVDRIRRRAEKDAADVTARYEGLCRQESERILARGRQAADERLARVDSSAALEGRKLELAAKQQLLDEAFALALEKLTALPEDRRIDLLAALAADGARTGREGLILSPADRATIGPRVAEAANALLAARRPDAEAGLALCDETRPIPGGVILTDGEVEINCAFDALVRMQREPLEKEVAALLFGK